jgi:hypothetical protein
MSDASHDALPQPKAAHRLLRRSQAAEFLCSCAIWSSVQILARQAMAGTGPKYTLISGTSYYRLDWLEDWIESQLTPKHHSMAHLHQEAGEGGAQ